MLYPDDPRKSPASRAKAWTLGRLLVPFVSLARALPEHTVPKLGDTIGELLYVVSAKLRRVALANLTYVYGDCWTRSQIVKMAKQVFRNFGRTAVEFVRLPTMSPEWIRSAVRIDGLEHMRQAHACGRGTILITAHYGNWELLGARAVLEGFRMNVLARTADDALTDRVINEIRGDIGFRVFARGGSLMPVLRCLRQNEVVGMLLDQNFRSGIFVEFFGRLAATATGPAELALRTGAPVVSAFIERLPDNTHLIRFGAVPVSRTNNHEADVKRLTQQFTTIIEEAIRRRPDQWMWFHNRWKHRPESEAQLK